MTTQQEGKMTDAERANFIALQIKMFGRTGDDSGWKKITQFICKQISEIREEGRKEGEISMNKRAAKVAFLCPNGYRDVARIRALFKEGKEAV